MIKKILLYSNVCLASVIILGAVLLGMRLTDSHPLAILSSFQYGVAVEEEVIPENINIISGPWVGSSWSEKNDKWLTNFRSPNRQTQIPYINMYVVAGMASATNGLKDCNVGAPAEETLCVSGANFIRENKPKIFRSYFDTASKIKSNFGVDKPIFLHFEPDFYQYSNSTQKNGGLSADELSKLMNSWTDIYKEVLPNARLVMDVSPWNPELKNYSSKFRNFEFGGLVGKKFQANGDGYTQDGIDGKTFKEISDQIGKQLIINNAHGPAGKWLPYDKSWNNDIYVKSRFRDGVVVVIQPPTDLLSLTNAIEAQK